MIDYSIVRVMSWSARARGGENKVLPAINLDRFRSLLLFFFPKLRLRNDLYQVPDVPQGETSPRVNSKRGWVHEGYRYMRKYNN